MVTAGANLDPFAKGLKEMTTISASAGAKIKTALSAQAIGLEGQIIAAKRAGTSWAGYATELEAVKAQLAQVNALMATQNAEIVAGGAAAAAATGKMRNMTVVSREILVVLREIGRGNWTRVPGSLTLLLQQFISLKWIVSAFGASLAAIGAAAYFTWKHIRNLNEELDRMGKLAEKGFGNMQEAQAEALKKQASAAADLHAWLEKLTEDNVTLAESTELAVKALREKYQLMREASTDKTGQTERRLNAQERQEELAILEKGLAAQQKKLEADKAAAIAAEEKASVSDDAKNREAKLIDLPGQTRDNDEEIKRLKGMQRVLQERYQDSLLNRNAMDPQPLRGETREHFYKNLQREAGPDGGGVKTSLEEVTAQLEPLLKQRGELQRTEARLTEEQRKLADAAREHREITEKDKASLKQLTERRDTLLNEIKNHAKYDAGILGKKGSYGTQHTTERERIGAYGATVNPLLDVAKQQLVQLVKIANAPPGGRDRLHEKPRGIPGVRFGPFD